jgi:tetratricopeptide (TPR) repeat protein
MSRRRVRWRAVLAVVAIGAVACGAPPPEAASGTVAAIPIPHPDLASADPRVREQVAERRAALEALQGAAGATPDELAEASGQLGLIYVLYDYLDAAAACFAHARAAAPGDYRWTYLGGYVHGLGGSAADAARAYERTLELAPGFLPAVLRLARLRLDLADLAAAEVLFRRALELDQRSAAAEEGLGRVAAARGDAEEAIHRFERALALQPDASGLRYALAQEHRRLGDEERAQSLLATSGDVITRIPDPLVNPLAEQGAGAQFYLVQGTESYENGDFTGASESYREAVARDPDAFAAYLGWSASLEQAGDLDGAVAALEAGISRAGTAGSTVTSAQRGELLARQGGLLAKGGRDAEAAAVLRRSLAVDDGQPAVHLRLADALARGGQFEAAVAHYDRVIDLLPDGGGPTVLERRATALVNLGRREEALTDFRRALAAAPDDPALRLRYAEALAWFGRDGEAAAERRRATELARTPGAEVELFARQGRLAADRGDPAAAAASYRRALALAPERSDLRLALAALLASEGRDEEALPEFHRVVEAEPGQAAAWHGEIASLLRTGRWGPARVRLNQALARRPRDRRLALTQSRLLAAAPDPRVRDPRLALEVARRVSEDHDDPLTRDTLALALAANGDFADATRLQRQVVSAAEAGPVALRSAESRLGAYRQGRPWVAGTADDLLAL